MLGEDRPHWKHGIDGEEGRILETHLERPSTQIVDGTVQGTKVFGIATGAVHLARRAAAMRAGRLAAPCPGERRAGRAPRASSGWRHGDRPRPSLRAAVRRLGFAARVGRRPLMSDVASLARVAARTVPAAGGRAGHRHDDHDDRRAAEPEPVLERAAAASDAHAHVKCSGCAVPAARTQAVPAVAFPEQEHLEAAVQAAPPRRTEMQRVQRCRPTSASQAADLEIRLLYQHVSRLTRILLSLERTAPDFPLVQSHRTRVCELQRLVAEAEARRAALTPTASEPAPVLEAHVQREPVQSDVVVVSPIYPAAVTPPVAGGRRGAVAEAHVVPLARAAAVGSRPPVLPASLTTAPGTSCPPPHAADHSRAGRAAEARPAAAGAFVRLAASHTAAPTPGAGESEVPSAPAELERVIGLPSSRRPARVDRLVSLFAESQEQLQDLCLHDPRQAEIPRRVVATQIELLTRRIEWYGKETDAASQAPSSGRTDGPVVLPVPAGLVKPTAPRPPARVIAAIDTSSRPDVGVDEVADEIVPPVLPKMHRWEASFDQAMRSKQHWKQDHAARVQRQAPAQPPAQQAPTRDRGTGADGLGKAPSNGELVAQLRAERERLEALLPRFERQQQRIVQLEQQPALDLAEQLQEEQRAAMAARAKELQECRRREQEAREREEQLRREQEEEERMRAQIYEQYQAEKRRLEEQRLQEREDERRVHEEMERLKRRAWEDEQRRAEALDSELQRIDLSSPGRTEQIPNVGEYHLSNQNPIEYILWDELVAPQDFMGVGSFYPQEQIRGCAIPSKAARRLQLIPDARPRGHVPIILEFTTYQHRATSETKELKWDRDKIAFALQEASGRIEFQEALESKFRECWELDRHNSSGDLDAYWNCWTNIAGDVAQSFFQTTPKEAHPQARQRAVQELVREQMFPAEGAAPVAEQRPRRAKAKNDGQAKTDLRLKGGQKTLQVLMLKFLLQLGQSKRNVEGVAFDCLILDGASQEATRMSAQGARYNEAVTASGKGRNHGPPRLWVFGGLLAALRRRKGAVGAASAKKLMELKQVIETWDMTKRGDMIKFCKMDQRYDVNKRKLMLHLHPEIRQCIIDAMVQTGTEWKQGRAPVSHMERELQDWLEACTKE
ncbi:unnamed protein product [Prorocentrum cordatum]|nr:unnamed protein product [Polarella glacialis]